MRAGVVGIGSIGAGVARALASGGHEVAVYDVVSEAADTVSDAATPVGSLREVADGADAVFLAVFDDQQVRDVIAGEDSVLAAATPPRAIVILSTVTLETIWWAAEQGAAKGVGVLDCGVTGGHGLREHGEIVAMIGGDEEPVAAIRPLIETFGKPTIHTGPLGTGMKAKIARNLYIYAGWLVGIEATRLAEAGDVSPERFIEICEAGDQWTGGQLGQVKRGVIPSVVPDEEQQIARRRLVSYVHKDLHAAIELAAELGVDVPAGRLADDTFEAILGIAAPSGQV